MRRESVARIALALTFAVSIAGVISACARFYSLDMLRTADKSARILEESFQVGLNVKFNTARVDLALQKDVGTEIERLKASRASLALMIDQQERQTLIDALLWILSSTLSAGALFAQLPRAGKT